MSSKLFISSILMVTTALVTVFYHFKTHFSGVDYFKSKAYALRDKVQTKQLEAQLAQYQLDELKQHVAVVLPNLNFKGMNYEQKYPYRNLASLVTISQTDRFNKLKADLLFSRGKDYFDQSDFYNSNLQFKKLITNYPSSVHVIRAHYFLVEGYFQRKEFEPMTDVIDQMVTLFPEDELTGHGLLRLVKVYEYEDRLNDANDVLDAVLKTYSSEKIRKLALKKRRALQ